MLAVFTNERPAVTALTMSVRAQLEQAERLLTTARNRLEAFAQESGRPGAKFLDLVASLYRPAVALIAAAAWLLARLSGAPLPTVITDLNNAAAALPPPDDLRDLQVGLAIVAFMLVVEPCEAPPVTERPPLNIAELKTHVHEALKPAATIPARVASLVEAPGWTAEDLDFVMAAPEFPTPMYRALAALSEDWLLPGLEHVPTNTLALLKTNPRFIEAFMVGLNHEMSRELLWRGYPTDQRGTYFRQFWDPSGRFPPPQDDAERKTNEEKGKDVPPLHEWGDTDLGTHFGKPRASSPGPVTETARVVLLIRGDLLTRYPRAVIYLAQAAWSKDQDNNNKRPRNPTGVELYPMFRGELAPDVQLLGFDVDPETARGTDDPSPDPNDDGAGWFVVIQQQPTEPRYGLDETAATSPSTAWTWRDLSWVHVTLTHENGYVKLAGGLTPTFPNKAQAGANGEAWRWTPTGAGAQPDSAQTACITLQEPVRVAVHASDLF